MSDFEKYIEAKYPNRSPKILFQKFEDIDRTLFYGIKEVEDQAEVWSHQQAIIDDLRSQLNNMEACYIQIKKINDEQSAIIQCHFAARQELQKRVGEYEKLTTSIRNEFDLWSDDSEFADVIEAQIENLQALRGAND
ncbi:hypothetical protein [Acinetobacter sp. BSP-53]|uniref:hypothetical protein n=1 Tax=Acinetobacter sp. BSP-53 TaxID=3344662 RepID=UPI00377057D1